ncbi:MAG: DMT family transporter [Candidatus Saccharibacteria bacterium]|nr:DMT family transporter [Moraxellaceae bacterium]
MSSPVIAQQRAQVLFGSICVLLSAFLFAIKAILIKKAYGLDPSLSAPTLLALRMVSALPFFLLIAYLAPKTTDKPSAKDWGILLIAGLVGYYLASILDFIGLTFITASLERIILFLYPTLTVIMMAILYKRPIHMRVIMAIILSYGGTLTVMLGEGVQSNPKGVWIGSLFVFASAFAYALYLVMTPTLIRRFGSWRFTGLAMSVACIASLVHYVIVQPMPIAHLSHLAPSIIGFGVALGFFSTVLPATFLMQGIARVGAAQAAMLSAGGPIITVVLAVLFLGESLSWVQWIGCALNIVGVLMITLRPAK